MLLRRAVAEKFNVLPPVTMLATGLVLIAASLIWPRVTVLHRNMNPGGVDFIQGFLIGIGVACEVMGIGSMLAGGRKRNSDPSDPA